MICNPKIEMQDYSQITKQQQLFNKMKLYKNET